MRRRQSNAAGESWRKWGRAIDLLEEPPAHPLMVLQPWWQYRAGVVGLWLVLASLGALAAVLVR